MSFWFRLTNVRTSKPSKSYRMNSYFANVIPSGRIEIFYQNNNFTNSRLSGLETNDRNQRYRLYILHSVESKIKCRKHRYILKTVQEEQIRL